MKRIVLARRKRSRLLLLLLLCVVCGLTYVKHQQDGEQHVELVLAPHRECVVPQLELMPKIFKDWLDFNQQPAELGCDQQEEDWIHVLDRTNQFGLRPGVVKTHGEKIICIYKPFKRKDDHSVEFYPSQTITFVSANQSAVVTILTDFFQIQCSSEHDKATFRSAYTAVVRDKTVEERVKDQASTASTQPLNVYILVLDSMSRLHFKRMLPLTYAALEKDYQVFYPPKLLAFGNVGEEQRGEPAAGIKAVILEQYNIVGDGTPQAMIPILTGQTEEELPLTRKRYKNANYVDVYPFVWKNYSANGFATLYGEDAFTVGTFTYRLKGFSSQPTDHYARTFFQQLEEDEFKHHKQHCLGSMPTHVAFWNYGAQFVKHYRNKKWFSLLHSDSLTHDKQGNPAALDKDLLHYLEWLRDDGHLNRSLLIVMADHGGRFGDLRSTHQGLLEERLPMMSFVAPKWFRDGKIGKQSWTNLRQNAKRLTTPFDLYPTLMDLLNWPPKQLSMIDQLPRSISLWTPIPKSRSCEQAYIEPHWCSCLNWEIVSINNSIVQTVANYVLQRINDATEIYRDDKCAKLMLTEIFWAKRSHPNRNMMKFKANKDLDGFVPDLSANTAKDFETYQLSIATEPGHGHFEVSVDHNLQSHAMSLNIDSISRINKFGDSPHCVQAIDYSVVKFCVCYDKIKH